MLWKLAKAADTFLTGRSYGICFDFQHKGFALFNYNMNELGNHLPGRLETLPLEDFDVEDILLCGECIVRKENITAIFFYEMRRATLFEQTYGHEKTEGIQQINLSSFTYSE